MDHGLPPQEAGAEKSSDQGSTPRHVVAEMRLPQALSDDCGGGWEEMANSRANRTLALSRLGTVKPGLNAMTEESSQAHDIFATWVHFTERIDSNLEVLKD